MGVAEKVNEKEKSETKAAGKAPEKNKDDLWNNNEAWRENCIQYKGIKVVWGNVRKLAKVKKIVEKYNGNSVWECKLKVSKVKVKLVKTTVKPRWSKETKKKKE